MTRQRKGRVLVVCVLVLVLHVLGNLGQTTSTGKYPDQTTSKGSYPDQVTSTINYPGETTTSTRNYPDQRTRNVNYPDPTTSKANYPDHTTSRGNYPDKTKQEEIKRTVQSLRESCRPQVEGLDLAGYTLPDGCRKLEGYDEKLKALGCGQDDLDSVHQVVCGYIRTRVVEVTEPNTPAPSSTAV